MNTIPESHKFVDKQANNTSCYDTLYELYLKCAKEHEGINLLDKQKFIALLFEENFKVEPQNVNKNQDEPVEGDSSVSRTKKFQKIMAIWLLFLLGLLIGSYIILNMEN